MSKKTLLIAGGAVALSSLEPHCAAIAPLLTFLGSVYGNLFSSAAEKDHASAREAADFLRNEQVATHVGKVAGAVLADFARQADASARKQFAALAKKLPAFWLQLHRDSAPGIQPLDGQEFIRYIAENLTQAKVAAALPPEQWLPVLAAASLEMPAATRPSEAMLGYAARHLATHLGEQLAVALTAPDDETQRVFRMVLLRFLGQLLLDVRALLTEHRRDAAQQREAHAEHRIYLVEIHTLLTEWRAQAQLATADGSEDPAASSLRVLTGRADLILTELGELQAGVGQLQLEVSDSRREQQAAFSEVGEKLATGFQDVKAAINAPRPVTKKHTIPGAPELFGREEDFRELVAAIEQRGAESVAISGLHGMGGVGKTALAFALAAHFQPSYPDAQILIDLRGFDPEGRPPLTPAAALTRII